MNKMRKCSKLRVVIYNIISILLLSLSLLSLYYFNKLDIAHYILGEKYSKFTEQDNVDIVEEIGIVIIKAL